MCRIVQGGGPRHTLMPRPGPITNAIAAFNPPKDARGAQTEGRGMNFTLIKLLNLKPQNNKLQKMLALANLNLISLR